ncbi:hypothetical protein [Leptotrichia sp. oral taxon 879]|uniref:hypothetical protein n=1 Tax=Leptotrichia sp. oral taxon 879 TaxID=1227267 RepID=UPI0003AE0823|nr:hypothetical protein [Leptotrichia sp. oral taxon 879]ERK52397.1 hypothetical protein HMPREF1552_00722 [Leptotrichia sp. oral taxon 879 str. F0557]
MKKSNKYVFDIEVFPNYFCIVLKKLNDDKILIIDSDNFNRQKKLLYDIISKNVLISYAGHGFDDIVINNLLKYRNSNVNRNKLNSEIKIIRNMPKDEYKSENHEFYSYDLAYEYNLNLGVKGFEFNCGDSIEEQDFANFNYVIKKNIYDEIVDKVIDYCLQDVLATEKMYNFIIKEKSNWDEKENLLNIITKGSYSNSMKLKNKIKYLKYNNDKLITLLLDSGFTNASQSGINYSKKVKMNDYDNYLQKKVYKLSIQKDYLYEWLIESKLLIEKDKNIIKKIPIDMLLNSSFAKHTLNRYKTSIIKRLKRIFAKENIEIVAVFENDIFITNINGNILNKIKKKIAVQYKNIFDIKDVDNFLKNKSSLLYRIGNEVIGTDEFYYSKLIMPRNHIWISEVLKLYFWEKKEIAVAVEEVFSKNPDIFFIYASVYEDIYACDENGKIDFESNEVLYKFRKYRLYFSKTGLYKAVMQKQEKYYEKYGFGDINSNLYKIRKVETNVKDFVNYDDIDLRSYVDYTRNYIQKYFE